MVFYFLRYIKNTNTLYMLIRFVILEHKNMLKKQFLYRNDYHLFENRKAIFFYFFNFLDLRKCINDYYDLRHPTNVAGLLPDLGTLRVSSQCFIEVHFHFKLLNRHQLGLPICCSFSSRLPGVDGEGSVTRSTMFFFPCCLLGF